MLVIAIDNFTGKGSSIFHPLSTMEAPTVACGECHLIIIADATFSSPMSSSRSFQCSHQPWSCNLQFQLPEILDLFPSVTHQPAPTSTTGYDKLQSVPTASCNAT